MNYQFDIKLNSGELLKFKSVEEYIAYLYSQFNPIKEPSIKKLKLTDLSILSEII